MTRIMTNIAAINAQRNLEQTSIRMGKTLEKLSSGYRINRAADDAAGLGISEKMRAQIRGNQQALRNVQDGISMLQTAEGAMDEVHSMLQRIRELAVQASNGTYTDNGPERTSLGQEIVQLANEIDRIAQSTEFNGQKLLTGNLSTTLAGGTLPAVGSTLTTATGVTLSALDLSGAQPGITYTIAAGTAANSLKMTATIAGVTTVQDNVPVADMSAGASVQTLNFGALGINLTLSTAAANAADTPANLITDLAQTIITSGATASSTLQVGANAPDTLALSFTNLQTSQLSGSGFALGGAGGLLTTLGTQTVKTITDAHNLMLAIDGAIQQVSAQRGTLGAAQNRLEHSMRSLGVAVENLSTSESRIRDADIAALSSEMVSNQILQQAGVSVLAQANQAPQAVLKLLQN